MFVYNSCFKFVYQNRAFMYVLLFLAFTIRMIQHVYYVYNVIY